MTPSHLNKEQLDELFTFIADGIERIYEQAEACGPDIDLNPARIYLLALGGFLNERGILDALVGYADVMKDTSILQDYIPENLPIV